MKDYANSLLRTLETLQCVDLFSVRKSISIIIFMLTLTLNYAFLL